VRSAVDSASAAYSTITTLPHEYFGLTGIHLYFEQINADPVIFRWKCKMNQTTIG
jgi:hypothetical protein